MELRPETKANAPMSLLDREKEKQERSKWQVHRLGRLPWRAILSWPDSPSTRGSFLPAAFSTASPWSWPPALSLGAHPIHSLLASLSLISLPASGVITRQPGLLGSFSGTTHTKVPITVGGRAEAQELSGSANG